jgi:hypothetical protein
MVFVLNPGDSLSAEEFEKILKLLIVDRGGKGNKPLAAEELLAMDREAFEPLFYEPPLGPIPDHLRPHRSVHGCVSEYEEKLEELERWKVSQLELWLQNRVGKTVTAGEKVYELSKESGEPSAPDRYWLRLVEKRESAN